MKRRTNRFSQRTCVYPGFSGRNLVLRYTIDIILALLGSRLLCDLILNCWIVCVMFAGVITVNEALSLMVQLIILHHVVWQHNYSDSYYKSLLGCFSQK